MADTIAPAWDALARKSRTALVRAERATLDALRKAVTASTTPALAKLARVPTGDRRAAAEAAIALVRGVTPKLTTAFAGALGAQRLATKGAALTRLADEWTAVRREVKALGFTDPGPMKARKILTPTDQAAVESTTSSYVAAWTSATSTALWAWADDDAEDTTPAGAVGDATEAQDFRVRRIATTDTAQAYSDAREDATHATAQQHRGAVWIPALLMRWDATLDQRLCKVCRGMHSTLRLWGTKWPGKRAPGHVHVNCRCDAHTVFVPLRIPPLESEAA